MAQLDFNANDVEPTAAFEPLPAGKYLAEITESEMKAVKSGSGTYLQLVFTVIEGPCKGRKVWDRLCLNHSKDLTQKIARGNLSAICRAVGVMQPRDSVELHNLPLVITVNCRKRKDTGEINNEVKGYAKRESAVSQPQQAPVNDQTPPWQRSQN